MTAAYPQQAHAGRLTHCQEDAVNSHSLRILRSTSALLLTAVTLLGCADESDAGCRHSSCDIREESCIDIVAEVVACQRDTPVVLPTIRFVTSEELIAEREEPTPEQLDFERDYWAGEALVGLMPEDYEPANAVADSLSGFVAFYRSDAEEIIILSDGETQDEEASYRVLVHEMIHAHQDVEYDLAALWAQHATTFPRSLGLRAALEGEAVLFTALAGLEQVGLTPEEVDWEGYFSDWQDDAHLAGLQSDVPSLDVAGLFPYAFGGEQVYRAWSEGGLDGVRVYVQDPPDSVRQVMLGYGSRPPLEFNEDADLAPRAVPLLPGHTYLGGGGQDAWLLNAMLQRTAGSNLPWNTQVLSVHADHLSVWRDDETGAPVAVWRLKGSYSGIQSMLTRPGSQWVESRDEATDHFLWFIGEDWVLVATQDSTAGAVSDSITGWQSQADAFETAGLQRGPRARELVLHDHGG